jgi:hypothetical protein
VNSQVFTLFRETFFLPVWTANKAKNSLSSAFSQKIFRTQNKTIHVTSCCRKKIKKIFCEKADERLFLAFKV